jgi:hypothetical protein
VQATIFIKLMDDFVDDDDDSLYDIEERENVMDTDQGVQLGFLEAYSGLLTQTWGQWDGGKVGGKPVWLNPIDIPTEQQLKCTNPDCGEPMTFLLQVCIDYPSNRFLYRLQITHGCINIDLLPVRYSSRCFP